jgi:hypothetical protein
MVMIGFALSALTLFAIQDKQPVFTCNMAALTSAERTKHGKLLMALATAKPEVKETAAGFSLKFSDSRKMWPLITEWAGYEARCCSFLTLTATLPGGKDAVLVGISGPAGAKGMIKAEIGSLFGPTNR